MSISHNDIREHINISNWEKEDYVDLHGHGTHVAGLILNGTCKEIELTSCKYFSDANSGEQNIKNSIECFKKAIKEHFDVINYSSSGPNYSQEEYDVLKQIKNTIIVVAVGNNDADLSIHKHYPACYNIKSIVAVGNLNGRDKNSTSNYGLKGMVWENGTNLLSTEPNGGYGIMSGSSQAAAVHSNRILKELCNQ